MRLLTVVTPQVDELRRHLAGKLPAAVEACYFASAVELDDRALQAEIAFGAPDQLAALIPRMPALRWVQSTWAGITPLLSTGREDYRLTGVKGLFGRVMSEYVLGWLLALDRQVIGYAQAQRWDVLPARRPAALRVGIAGVGSIGSAVAQRCRDFYGDVVGLNSDGRDVPGCNRCFPVAELSSFVDGLDTLVLLLPHTAQTTGLFDAAALQRLNQGAVLINAGRANALDMPAALTALESGRLSALVLDVLETEPLPADDPLWRTPGLYITCHSAAPTDSADISALFLDNLQRYLVDRPLSGLVDFGRGY